jgi:hypothetical protein
VQPIAVQIITLQSVLPDVTLRLGQSLVARVAERHGDRGILMIAGKPLVAELPEHVQRGDVLKLAVTDVSAEQVVMQLHEGTESAPMAQPGQQSLMQQAVAVPMPGGPAHIVVDDQASEGGGGRGDDIATVALTYESPALGPINLRLGMDAANVVADVRVSAGAPLELASAAAGALQASLGAATERTARVTVAPRPGSLNVSA